MNLRQLLFGGPGAAARAGDFGLLALRVIAGLALAFGHGIGKVPPADRFIGMIRGLGFPMPELFAWLAAFAEFAGGILLALGLVTRPVALLVTGHFAIVTLIVHAGDPFGDRELALLFGAIALLYLCIGAGRFSIDALLRNRSR